MYGGGIYSKHLAYRIGSVWMGIQDHWLRLQLLMKVSIFFSSSSQ